MFRKFQFLAPAVLSLLLALTPALSQAQTAADTASTTVPRLIRYSGTALDLDGKPLTGVVGITFSLYADQTGGTSLFLETQNVQADANGHYSVLLGSTKPDGLPADIFNSEQARWIGVQIEQQTEQARALLVSAPYALKAGDSETLGGLPVSAFVLAGSQGTTATTGASGAKSNGAKNNSTPANPDVTGKGTADYIPMWDTTSDILDSIIYQKSSKIGINTTSPATTLDVDGKTDVRDTLTLYPSGTDNTIAVNGTSFKVSSTGQVTFISGQTFPGAGTITGVTTASGSGLSGGGTSGTLSLKVPSAGITNAMLANSKVTLNASTAGGLTVPGAMTLGSTYTIGLKTCSANQVLKYVGSAWTCETAGTGTVTSVATGAGLTGGPITGSGTISIPSAGVTNPMLANSSLTVSAGTGLTGGGSVSLGGTTTLNINTSVVPELSSANTFSGSNTFSGTSNTFSNSAYFDSDLREDANGLNAGSYTPGLRFGTGSTGEGIASARTSGSVNQFGLDFYTGFTRRMSVTNGGEVGVGTASPFGQFESNDVASTGFAIYGESAVESATSVWGDASATAGESWGVEGSTESTDSFAFGVAGYATATSGSPIGVYGYSFASGGLGVQGGSTDIGVNGQGYGTSTTGAGEDFNIGVWGDTGGASGSYIGVLGTADDNWAGYFLNNSDSYPTMFVSNAGTGGTGLILQAHGNSGDCTMDTAGDVGCTGTVTSVVPADNGTRKVSLYAMQAADNWFEDAGSGQLSNGSATVALDPTFAQTVNTGAGYHVFLTPNGDCKGLYVSQKSATSFEVHELGGGSSSIAFDYRIMAKRSGYETVRLTDVTQQYQQMENQQQLRKAQKALHQLAKPKGKPSKGPKPAALMAKKGK